MSHSKSSYYQTLGNLKAVLRRSKFPPAQQYFNRLVEMTGRDASVLVDPLRLPPVSVSNYPHPTLTGGDVPSVRTTLMNIRIGNENNNIYKGLTYKMFPVSYNTAVKTVQQKIKKLFEANQKLLSVQLNTTSHLVFDNYMHVVLTYVPTQKKRSMPVLTRVTFKSWKDLKLKLQNKLQTLTGNGRRILSISVDHQTRPTRKPTKGWSPLDIVHAKEIYHTLAPVERLNVFILHSKVPEPERTNEELYEQYFSKLEKPKTGES